MNFKYWLEAGEENYNLWKDIILGFFGLDPNQGMSQPLPDDRKDRQNLGKKLEGLGKFGELPSEGQTNILNFIYQSPGGTYGDLIRKISDEDQGKENMLYNQ